MGTLRPMTQEQLIVAYETLLQRSCRMLDWARQEDWNALVNEESQYVIEVERLSQVDGTLLLDASQQERRAQLLERVLENDLEIRQRLMARRDALSELIGSSQRKRDLNRAYRPPAGASPLPEGHS
ncbi:flagellar protein FliT [Litchfieldella xinjiangensis]|uniref:flagellar protein FliT n=1 Tax=Litchfieldella xinjiangensis TaxID=1166948 RepID=UPI0005BD2EA4|nr:flagellar protein FliT [Halomonas xinjiangensis]